MPLLSIYVELLEIHLTFWIFKTNDSPNSCGQVQVADIGIMGGPARKLDPETGKMMAVPGCKIFVGKYH